MTGGLAGPPGTVAVVGASPRRFFARWTVHNTLRHRFGGRLLLVHPSETELLGRPVYPSLDALPEPPDLAFLALGAASCPDAVRALGAMGCPVVVVLSDGFAETGTPEGVALQAELVAASAGLTMIGPNCMGLADLAAGLVGIAGPVGDLVAGPVSVVSQSGGLLAAVLDGLAAEGVGADLCLSIGNGASFSLADGLGACVERRGTEVVATYVEGVGDDVGPLEAALAALARAGKQVVAHIPGQSATGRRLVESHTARVAGPHALVTALFERHGAVVAPSMETLVRTAALARVVGRRRGGVAVVTGSGGAASLTGDAAEAVGMPLATYGPATVEALRTLIPASGTVGNPTDLSGGLTDSSAVMRTVAADPGVAALFIPFTAPFPDDSPERDSHRRYIEAAMEAASASGCPLLVVSVVDQPLPDWTAGLRARPDVAVVQGLTLTARALGLLLRPVAPPVVGDAGSGTDRPGAAAPAPLDPRFLSERDGRSLLEESGLAVVPGRFCGPGDDPVSVAAAIGYPLIAKVVVPGLAHKAAAGAVSSPLAGDADLLAACRRMAGRCEEAGIAVEGFLFEQVADGPELLVGLRRDPVYGPFLTLGLGGHLAEAGVAGATILLGEGTAGPGSLIDRAGIGPLVDATGLRADLVGYLGLLMEAFLSGPLSAAVTVEANPLFLSAQLGVVAADVLVERPGP